MELLYQQKISQLEIHASVDRLTIVGKTKFKDLFESNLRSFPSITKVNPSKYPYRMQYEMHNDEYRSEALAFIQVTGNDAVHVSPIRIDFNPNNLPEFEEQQLRRIISMLTTTRLSRIDTAIDYIGRDLSELQWHEERERKRQLISDSTGRMETLYLGAFSSQRFTRIYDKGKEQKRNIPWWRVEAQVRMKRGDIIYQEDPFDGLYAIEKGTEYELMNLEQYATLQYIQQHPESIQRLSKQKRAFYRKMLTTAEKQFSPTPSEVFRKEKGNLRQQIANWVKPINPKLPHQL